jgi:hypothetical protein
MKKTIFYILFICLFVSTGLAYTYEIYTYGGSKNLTDNESILFADEGGMDNLILENYSTATIEMTSVLVEGSGGIWEIDLVNNSSLIMFDGQVNIIDISGSATATLYGGLIQSIYSYQIVPDPHITLYYSGNLPTVQKISGYDFLVGQWSNGDPFSIYLHDTGYNVYGNFNFILIPEPITLALIAFGGLLIRKK